MDNQIRVEEQKVTTARAYKVVKHNDLIRKSRFSLSAQEQKIVLYIISKIKPTDTELSEQEFSIMDFCKACGIDHDNGQNYRDIKSTIKGLRDKSIWITLEDGTETTVSWVNKVFINKQSGIIRVKLDDDMKPYLLQLKGTFTQYELLYTLAMKSQYSIKLYELLKSYEFKHSKEFDIDELKKLLIAENYDRFPDFKRKVLDIAMREIESFSDLVVSYEIKKEGRRYASLVFSIKLKEDAISKLQTWKNIDERISPRKTINYDNLLGNAGEKE